MIQKDYYYILNVESNTSASEIRRAYRRLALELHPDHHPEDPESEEKFKQISEAYSVLGDAQKRRDYDLLNHPRSMMSDNYGRVDKNMDSRYWNTGRGNGCGRKQCGIVQNTKLNDVLVGQIYEIILTPEEARLGTDRFVVITVEQKRRGYRIRIPVGIKQGTQFKAILGRDENRYILVRVTIRGAT
jgi:curved DNA-binding protein CbpA